MQADKDTIVSNNGKISILTLEMFKQNDIFLRIQKKCLCLLSLFISPNLYRYPLLSLEVSTLRALRGRLEVVSEAIVNSPPSNTVSTVLCMIN
jgi:hypothetical protein